MQSEKPFSERPKIGRTYRAWINQPSTLQPLHALHGKYCIAQNTGGGGVRLWFTEGPVHSMDAMRLWISECYLSATQQG